jgi:hypothetical protein
MAHSKKFNRSNKANKRRMNKTKNKKKRTKNKSNKRNMLRKKFSLKKQKKKNKNLRGGSLQSGTPGPKASTEKMISPLSQSLSPLSPPLQSHFKLPSTGTLSRTVSDNSAPPPPPPPPPIGLTEEQISNLGEFGKEEDVINMINRGRKLLEQQNRLNKRKSSVRTRSVPPGMRLG